MLNNEKMVCGLPSIHCPKKTCEGCVIGKQPRKMFKIAAPQTAKKPFGVVHSDVCGSFHVSSLGGNKYFLTFVDEFTRKIWLYLLKEKKEVFSLFVKWRTHVERQSE